MMCVSYHNISRSFPHSMLVIWSFIIPPCPAPHGVPFPFLVDLKPGSHLVGGGRYEKRSNRCVFPKFYSLGICGARLILLRCHGGLAISPTGERRTLARVSDLELGKLPFFLSNSFSRTVIPRAPVPYTHPFAPSLPVNVQSF